MIDRPDIFQLNLDPGGSLAITRSTNVFPPEDVTTVYNPADALALLDFLTEHADTIRTSAVRADAHHSRVSATPPVAQWLKGRRPAQVREGRWPRRVRKVRE